MARSAERIRVKDGHPVPEDTRSGADAPERSDAGTRLREKKPAPPQTPPGRGDERPDKDEAPSKTGSFFRRPIVIIGGIALLLLLIIGGLLWWLNARNYESTDDAFIDAHIVRIASQIAGRIATVAVNDNQLVQPGDPLVEIAPEDAQTRLAQANAQQAQAQAQLGQAQAQIRATEASHEQTLAAIAAADAQAQNAAKELARYRSLLAIDPQAVAQQQLDQAEAAARTTAAQRNAVVKQAQGVEAQKGAAEAQAKAAEAEIGALRAQVAGAQINLGYTRVVAPIAGHIAQRSAAPGNYVAPGQQMMAIVPLEIWVTANFKETQLALMRVGQPVDIHVDACPDAHVTGHIDSIQRGAGQAFGLLPPENATGNFIKVVQRVPVKIVFDSIPKDCPLGPGMSVEPTVKVR